MNLKHKFDITIAILNFNNSKYLDRAYRSCADQSLTNKSLEIIIIDDCSTDNSIEYLDYIKKIKNFKNLKIIKNKKNRGIGFCSKLAVKLSKGKYFMRVDSDDYLNRYAADTMCNILEYNKNLGYVYCDHFRTDKYGFKQELVKLNSTKKKYLHGAGILFRRDTLLKAGNYNSKFREAEDHEIIKKIDKISQSFYLPVPLYRYFIHGQNISLKKTRKKYVKLIV